VVTQTQLLFLAALAVVLLIRVGIYPAELRATNLDFDWFYRRLGAGILAGAGKMLQHGWRAFTYQITRAVKSFADGLHTYHGPSGLLARSWQTSNMAFWTSVVLAAYLLFLYL
jgi:multicomponent Na+:H+ antiporter subunit D